MKGIFENVADSNGKGRDYVSPRDKLDRSIYPWKRLVDGATTWGKVDLGRIIWYTCTWIDDGNQNELYHWQSSFSFLVPKNSLCTCWLWIVTQSLSWHSTCRAQFLKTTSSSHRRLTPVFFFLSFCKSGLPLK